MSEDREENSNSALELWKEMAKNPFSRWTEKGDSGNDAGSRIRNGFVIPEVEPSFAININKPIFTIGSCFARNIEDVLATEGAQLPAKSIVSPKASSLGVRPNSVLNKYNIPSILQEIQWSFENTKDFSKEHLLDAGDLHFDPHVHEIVASGHESDLIAQHAKVTDVFKQLKNAQTIVMTLGMTEMWYDNLHEIYLNAAPILGAIKRNPSRFDFRILSYQKNETFLVDCIDCILSTALPGANIILTVSPVALGATFSHRDVIIANSQSKATLVALAQAVAIDHPQVDYFPSFEAVTWSDPLFAWENDRRHVSAAMVSCIMSEFLYRYAGKPKPQWPSFKDNRGQQLIVELQQQTKSLAKKLSWAQTSIDPR
ncbi:MAG: GSCFA domain-containing protein [Rhodospirillaceae bacterium]